MNLLGRPTPAQNVKKPSMSSSPELKSQETETNKVETFEISLFRHSYFQNYTAGRLQIGGSYWHTLEDAARKVKIMNKTCIPAGRYKIVPYVFSSVYQIRPLLKDVPNFTGVFIHPGNTDKDTSGCLLVGKNQSFGYLMNSRVAYSEVCTHLCDAWGDGKDVWLTINDLENHPWFDEVMA